MTISQSLPSSAAVTRTSGIVLDPHHRAILDALNGRLDPDVFELCAADLLRADWPALVSVRGGRDHGFDGAVADRDSQEPFPLVVTTGESLVQNFRASLDSARRNGWSPERALFATSRRITPAIRRTLFDVAQERDVQLVQTYDRDWFAGRLYREPQWCKRLLGVTGRPSALSLFPVSRRPVLGDNVLGREREKKWLLEPRGDCLLVGEPGSGKTFLLRALALEGRARFLVGEDPEQIANDIRSLKPEAVIVDDAHIHPESIRRLAQIRSEIHADFRIVATCWPGDADGIKAELQVGQSDLLTLERIDADTMIEVIKSVGIQGPDELLRTIRRQAAGRPGLATTLAHLCLIGDVDAAISGEGLLDAIEPALSQVLEVDAMRLLAPFALGGDAGVRQAAVAERFNMSLLDTSTALATLGAAGIVRERRGTAISVEPDAMRYVLVKRVFFNGAGSLPFEPFLSVVQSRPDALRTLIGAHARGAEVPELRRLLEEAGSESLWTYYAYSGPAAAKVALAQHPEFIRALAEPALAHIPDTAIPLLLSQAQEEFASGINPRAALKPLEHWIKSGNARNILEAIECRRTLVKCCETWWRQSRNGAVSITAMCVALNPEFESVTSDPGAGTRITLSQAILDAEMIDQLAMLWSAVMTVVNEETDIPWTDLIDVATNWHRGHLKPDDETRAAASRFLSRLLSDLGLASRERPGVQHRIAQLAKRVGAAVATTVDTEFECLYPQMPDNTESLDEEFKCLEEGARQLGENWSMRPTDDVTRFLGRIEAEARRANIIYPRFTPIFCRTLVKSCPDPAAVAIAFIRERLPADLVEPFLGAGVVMSRRVWSIVSDCLEDSLYVSVGIKLAICHNEAPHDVIFSALQRVEEAPPIIEHCAANGAISEVAIVESFGCSEVAIAVSAAIGHWMAYRHSATEIPKAKAWQDSVLRSADTRLSSTDCYWISEILQSDPDLAMEWLIRFLDSNQASFGFFAQKVAKNAIEVLDGQRRIAILTTMGRRHNVVGLSEVVKALVGNIAEVYAHLLQSNNLRNYHLSPLMGDPNTDWRNVAILALDHGYSCEDVVRANLAGPRLWQGDESEMWAERRRCFEKLQDDNDVHIAEVGQLGAEIVGKSEMRAKEREREEAIYGVS